MSGPLKCGLCASLVGGMLMCSVVPQVLAEDPNNGYPAALVPLPRSLLICQTPEEVEAAFEGWRLAFESRSPERLPEGCVRVAEGLFAKIEYMGRFDNDHWTADLLKYFVFREQAHGVSLLVGVYYGYGTPELKSGMPARTPMSERL